MSPEPREKVLRRAGGEGRCEPGRRGRPWSRISAGLRHPGGGDARNGRVLLRKGIKTPRVVGFFSLPGGCPLKAALVGRGVTHPLPGAPLRPGAACGRGEKNRVKWAHTGFLCCHKLLSKAGIFHASIVCWVRFYSWGFSLSLLEEP